MERKRLGGAHLRGKGDVDEIAAFRHALKPEDKRRVTGCKGAHFDTNGQSVIDCTFLHSNTLLLAFTTNRNPT
jgi:hypothetical protein